MPSSPRKPVVMTPCACGFAPAGAEAQAYNEEAFTYLLQIERRRAARTSQRVVLLVVAIRRNETPRLAVTPDIAAAIFTGLQHGIRDVDFVGWLRESQVAAAVLTQGRSAMPADASRRVGNRVIQALRAHVPARVARLLAVRVLHLRT